MPDPTPQPDEDGLEGSNVEGFVFALDETELRTAEGWHLVTVASLKTGPGFAQAPDGVCLELLPNRESLEVTDFEDVDGVGVWVTLSRDDAQRLKRALERLL